MLSGGMHGPVEIISFGESGKLHCTSCGVYVRIYTESKIKYWYKKK